MSPVTYVAPPLLGTCSKKGGRRLLVHDNIHIDGDVEFVKFAFDAFSFWFVYRDDTDDVICFVWVVVVALDCIDFFDILGEIFFELLYREGEDCLFARSRFAG